MNHYFPNKPFNLINRCILKTHNHNKTQPLSCTSCLILQSAAESLINLHAIRPLTGYVTTVSCVHSKDAHTRADLRRKTYVGR